MTNVEVPCGTEERKMSWLRVKQDPDFAHAHMVWKGHHRDDRLYRGEVARINVGSVRFTVEFAGIAVFNPALNKWLKWDIEHSIAGSIRNTEFFQHDTDGYYTVRCSDWHDHCYLVPQFLCTGATMKEWGAVVNRCDLLF